ncbi:Ribosome-associated translation inhibitor RaiA [Planctomycetales bacterium 10988]|nr:Ribosome-associated translation inhibitor RaiA [Planctomycetales bacterium 10988]
MQIKISSRHGSLSEDAQANIRGKVEKLLNHFDRLMEIEVTVDLEHDRQPEVTIHVDAEHKRDLVASAKAETVLTAVDQAVSKQDALIRKYKEKLQNHHPR